MASALSSGAASSATKLSDRLSQIKPESCFLILVFLVAFVGGIYIARTQPHYTTAETTDTLKSGCENTTSTANDGTKSKSSTADGKMVATPHP